MIDIEEIIRLAKDYVLRHGDHPPTLYVHGTVDNAALPFYAFPDVHEKKILFLAHAGKQLAESGKIGMVTEVFFISEAWISMAKKDGSFIQPSRDPDRKEVLIISGLNVLDEKQNLAVLDIVRDSNGELRELIESSRSQGDEVKSPLLPAFVLGYTFGNSTKKR